MHVEPHSTEMQTDATKLMLTAETGTLSQDSASPATIYPALPVESATHLEEQFRWNVLKEPILKDLHVFQTDAQELTQMAPVQAAFPQEKKYLEQDAN